MALEIKSTITEGSGCSSFTIFDTTGNYHAFNNPGGWGSPNPETTDVTSVILEVGLVGYTSTAISYDITSSFADLFTSDGLDITSTQIFNTDTFQDGSYYIKYTVVVNGLTYYSYYNYEAFMCGIKCCVRKMSLNLKLPVENYKNVEDTYLANILLQTAEWAGCCGNSDNVAEIIEYLRLLCAGCGSAQIASYVSTSGSSNTGCCS